MNEPDEIRTARLLLRRVHPDDEADFVDLHTDPETHRHRPGGARTPDQAIAVFHDFVRQWDVDGIGYWTITLASTGETVGFGGVRPAEEAGRRILNVYYRLRPSAWGHGYAPEMARAALDWARRERPELPLVIITRPDNAPARRVADKLGFEHWFETEKDGFPETVYRLP